MYARDHLIVKGHIIILFGTDIVCGGLQQVDDGAGTHLIAFARTFQRNLGGNQGGFGGVKFGYAILEIEKGGLGVEGNFIPNIGDMIDAGDGLGLCLLHRGGSMTA